MMYVWANNAGTAPANPIGPSDFTIVVEDGDVFPPLNGVQTMLLTIEEGDALEIVQMTARAGNTISLGARGMDGTSLGSFTTEATIEARLTAGQINAFAQRIDNAHEQPISPYTINLQPGRSTKTRVASGNYAVAVGYDTLASGTGAIAQGASATASADDSLALGADTQATSAEAMAIGSAARATGLRAMAIGPTMAPLTYFVSGQEAIGIGYNVINSGAYGVAMGTGAQVQAINALAAGHNARAFGAGALYVGNSSDSGAYFAKGADSIAMGTDAYTGGQYDIAIGRGSDADGGNAIALGQGAAAAGVNAIAIGGLSNATADFTCNITATSLMPAPLTSGLTATNHLALQTAMVSALGTAAFSLGAVADALDIISMPTGTKFFPTDVMLIITEASGAAGTPAISVGSASGGDSILASTTASGLTSAGAAQSWPATSSAGVTAIYVNVTGTDAASGRVIIRGVLVAD
jgi:hypothetical protein